MSEEPLYVQNGYVYTVYNQKKMALNPRQYATRATANKAQQMLQERLPEAGPYQVVSIYHGDAWNRVLQGDGHNPDNDPKLYQLSIRRFDSETLHNAGEVYNALSNGYTYPLEEFKAEAGLA